MTTAIIYLHSISNTVITFKSEDNFIHFKYNVIVTVVCMLKILCMHAKLEQIMFTVFL